MSRRLIFTGNVKTTLFNTYVPGAGVGGLNRSVRKALYRSYGCISNTSVTNPCPENILEENQIITNMTQLQQLSGVTQINGLLLINLSSDITTLTSLSCLNNITGNFIIGSNSELINLDGLSNLTNIGGDLLISLNSKLTNLNGLSNLTNIGGYINIISNDGLTDVTGLRNIKTIGTNITLGLNAALNNVSIEDSLRSLSNWGSFGRTLNGATDATAPGNFSADAATALFALPVIP
jgi:hypothetical protein